MHLSGSDDGSPLTAGSMPRTRRALAATGRRVAATFLLGIVCLVGFGLAVTVVADRNDALRNSGGRTSGDVYDVHPDSGHSSGSVLVEYTVAGVVHHGRVDVGADADNYSEGQAVTVFYDRDHPSQMTIDDEDNQPSWSVWPVEMAFVGGSVSLIIAVVQELRRRTTRRLLHSGPWQSGRVRVLDAGKRSDFTTPDGAVWRSGIGTRWPTPNQEPRKLSGWGLTDEDPASVLTDQPVWWVADGRRAVFSADQGMPLVLARRRRDRG